jgi:hypothetical protein
MARGRDTSREPAPSGERPRIALQPRTKPLGVELYAPVPTVRKVRPERAMFTDRIELKT